MNNTKWNELRDAMSSLENSPAWTTLCANGHRSHPDREWFYHFSEGGYDDILSVDILVEPSQRQHILRVLQQIHLPGEETADGFRVYGYARSGQILRYL
ncbi:DUF6678 family protein [Aliirhizobium smilacinae]|uniref:Uncharacterized protein n=1 Tax=Aliirhizobium smilacinae TaxID=1395944 RepID=A0A5C4XNW7_9HYPH|nr:hypothetical protein FHP24_02580 [Rhizobium smilacinae]